MIHFKRYSRYYATYRGSVSRSFSKFTLFQHVLKEISKEVENGWTITNESVDILFCLLQIYFSEQILFAWEMISELWITSSSENNSFWMYSFSTNLTFVWNPMYSWKGRWALSFQPCHKGLSQVIFIVHFNSPWWS